MMGKDASFKKARFSLNLFKIIDSFIACMLQVFAEQMCIPKPGQCSGNNIKRSGRVHIKVFLYISLEVMKV